MSRRLVAERPTCDLRSALSVWSVTTSRAGGFSALVRQNPTAVQVTAHNPATPSRRTIFLRLASSAPAVEYPATLNGVDPSSRPGMREVLPACKTRLSRPHPARK